MSLLLAVGLRGGEREVKGGGGLQSMRILPTLDKAAVADISGGNNWESLVKCLLFQSMLHEVLHAYLRLRKLTEADHHPSQNGTAVLPYSLIEMRLFCRKEMLKNLKSVQTTKNSKFQSMCEAESLPDNYEG